MKKLVGLAVAGLCVSSLVSMAGAQGFELGVDLGYGLAAGGQNYAFGGSLANETYNSTGTRTAYDEIYASGGNGMKIGVGATLFLTENLGVMLASGFSFLGGFTQEITDPTTSDKTVMNASYIPINLGLKLRAKTGSIDPYVYVAPGLYIAMMSGEYTSTGNPKETISTKLSPGFGFTSGIGAAFMLSEGLGLKVEVNPTYAFANLTEMSSDNGTQKSTTTFQNNTPVLPTGTTTATEQTSYSHDQPRVSFSSIALKAGVSIGF